MADIHLCPYCKGECAISQPYLVNYHVVCQQCSYTGSDEAIESEAIQKYNALCAKLDAYDAERARA